MSHNITAITNSLSTESYKYKIRLPHLDCLAAPPHNTVLCGRQNQHCKCYMYNELLQVLGLYKLLVKYRKLNLNVSLRNAAINIPNKNDL